MDPHIDPPGSAQGGAAAGTLRQRAEQAFGAAEIPAPEADLPEVARRLVHELRVHQIELELQNEELRQAQEDLELARARYFDLYDLAPVGYVTLSAQGLIQEANLTAATILRLPRGALIMQPFTRFIVPMDQDRYYQHHRRLIATAEPQLCELRMKRADAPPFWARLDSTVARDLVSGAAAYRTVISDITARVEAEIQLHELNTTLEQRIHARTAALAASEEQLRRTNTELSTALRLKDEFLAMMSHELRTPLNAILSFTEAMSEGIYGPIAPRQHQALAMVIKSGRHLLDLISDILDLARITVGREILDRRPIVIADLYQACLMYVRPAAEAKGIQLGYTIQEGLVLIQADERRLAQILVNLLSNAVKFTPPGGRVDLAVSADPAQEWVQLSVHDTGIGIAAEEQERLFEPFTQIDQRLARQYEGAGLGLALVYRLTDLHGGAVHLKSTPDQGSCFTIALPWSPDGTTLAGDPPGSEPSLPPWGAPLRIVLADDTEPTLQIYTDQLRRRGCEVTVAHTDTEALDQIRATHPDLAILDIQKPGVDGLAVIRTVRADPGSAQMPIIALTALVTAGSRERCLGAGATCCLAKPVSLHTLLTTIAEALTSPTP